MMRIRSKKLLAVIAAAAMIVGLTPVMALAKAPVPVSYVTVNGNNVFKPADPTQAAKDFNVVSGEVLYILSNDAVISTGGQTETQITEIHLTENATRATIDNLVLGTGRLDFSTSEKESGENSWLLQVKGNNVITYKNQGDDAIYTTGDLEIAGVDAGASLTIHADLNDYSIYTSYGDVTIRDLASLAITNGDIFSIALTLEDIADLALDGRVRTVDALTIKGNVNGYIHNPYDNGVSGAFVQGEMYYSMENGTGFFAALDSGSSVQFTGTAANTSAITSRPGIYLTNTQITEPAGGVVGTAYVEDEDEDMFAILDSQGNQAPEVTLTGGKAASKKDDTTSYEVKPSNTNTTTTAPAGTTTPANTTTVTNTTNTTAPELNAEDHSAYFFGFDDGEFKADENLTRGQAASLLTHLTKGWTTEGMTSAYTDLADKWYAPYVNFLSTKGILDGQKTETFRGDDAITRAEFCDMAVRYFKWTGAAEDTFTDVDEKTPYYDSILAATAMKFVSGDGNGLFRPNDPITRQEAASMLNRVLSRKADQAYITAHMTEVKTFPDVTVYDEAAKTGDWGYWDILEAANGHDYTRTDAAAAEVWTALK